MRLIALALCLTLAACSPAVYVTPGAGDVLPVQAQRIIDAATATAGAQATQAAQATATGQSARETATAASLGTLGALAARQTEVALSLTQGAGLAAATDTQAARTQAAGQTQAWATPTAAAMRAQATAQAADNARRAAQAESASQFWATVRTLIIALLIVAGLSAICVAVVDALTRIRVARLAEQAAIAREAFRLLAPGHWAEWQAGDGYRVYPLPGLLDEPAAIIENAPTTPDRAHAWRQAVRLFAWWGDRYGFGVRELGPAGAGVVTDPAWRCLSKLLKGAGVLAELPIPGQKGRATAWAPDWNYRRLHDDLGHGRLTLPYPADSPAPEVRYTVPNTTPQIGQHNTATHKESERP
jgi:hypothetical protein